MQIPMQVLTYSGAFARVKVPGWGQDFLSGARPVQNVTKGFFHKAPGVFLVPLPCGAFGLGFVDTLPIQLILGI